MFNSKHSHGVQAGQVARPPTPSGSVSPCQASTGLGLVVLLAGGELTLLGCLLVTYNDEEDVLLEMSCA